jgi:ubiquinone/menaquinone biosynthesis C-methylase UbiE
MTSTYGYRNDDGLAVAHHSHLSAILDPHTIPRLSTVCSLTGLACLEVGAGAGSIAAWLADEVGPDGPWWPLDLHSLPVPYVQRLTVVRHDITSHPVLRPPFDLIRARLVLMHLPQRPEVLRALVNTLMPGGALVVEDWDQTRREGRVLCAPSPADKSLFEYFHDCLIDAFAESGVDPGWASMVPVAMVDAGLADVSVDYTSESWRAPGFLPLAGSIAQMRDQLVKQGLTSQDLDRVRELMNDPHVMIRTPPFVSTAGVQAMRVAAGIRRGRLTHDRQRVH